MLSTTLSDLKIPDDRATALFRILQEALTNVVRHAEAQCVEIGLTADADAVRLVVHDDGRGIPAAEALNPRALGLVGMRDRALLFGGDVTRDRPSGRGHDLTVTLPARGAFHMIRVTLVDDHPIVRRGLKETLSAEADIVVVGEAARSEEVLAALAHSPCDVVLLDISLPGRGGLDVLKDIRRSFPDVRVLVVSTHDESQYAVRACVRVRQAT